MGVPTPRELVLGLFAWCFGRLSRKGLFLCNGESPAGDLLGELLVKFIMLLLKGGGIEAVAENGSPTDDEGVCLQLFYLSSGHLGLDAVLNGLCFGLGLGNDLFPFFEGSDLLADFDA